VRNRISELELGTELTETAFDDYMIENTIDCYGKRSSAGSIDTPQLAGPMA
jgi:hypothetical protein